MLNRILAVLTLIVTIITLILCVGIIRDNKETSDEWYSTRTTTTITVRPNKTLWAIAEEYKPSWMDTREYVSEIKSLNNMSTSFLDVGQTLDVYVECDNIMMEVTNSEKSSVHD